MDTTEGKKNNNGKKKENFKHENENRKTYTNFEDEDVCQNLLKRINKLEIMMNEQERKKRQLEERCEKMENQFEKYKEEHKENLKKLEKDITEMIYKEIDIIEKDLNGYDDKLQALEDMQLEEKIGNIVKKIYKTQEGLDCKNLQHEEIFKIKKEVERIGTRTEIVEIDTNILETRTEKLKEYIDKMQEGLDKISNYNSRQKHLKEQKEIDDTIEKITEEMETIKKELGKDLREKHKWEKVLELEKEINKVKKKESKTREEILYMKNMQKLEDIKKRNTKEEVINEVIGNFKETTEKIKRQEIELKELEQLNMKKNAEVHNLPEKEGENLKRMIVKIAEKKGVKIAEEEIDLAYRYRTRTEVKHRPITVKFRSEYARDEFIRWKKGNEIIQQKEIIKEASNTENIFIYEGITQHYKELRYKVKRWAHNRNLNVRTWYRNYHIWIKDDDTNEYYKIKTEEELKELEQRIRKEGKEKSESEETSEEDKEESESEEIYEEENQTKNPTKGPTTHKKIKEQKKRKQKTHRRRRR